MKHLNMFLLLCIVLFASCSQEQEGGYTKEQTAAATAFNSPNHFYGMGYPEGKTTTKGIAQRDNLWYPNTTIKVKLLNDPYNMAAKVKEYASEWTKWAGIKFEFVTEGDAHVRIGFDWNANRYITWSYVGTDCKMVTNQNEATMSFAYWDTANEAERKGDVLRAFGLALGLELEHRNLSFNPGWTASISQYWQGEVSDIPWNDLKKYVFDPLEKENAIYTDEYDANSIMVWPFNRKYAANTARDFNNALSAGDIEFIQRLYPNTSLPEGDPIITFKANGLNPGFALSKDAQYTPSDDILVYWGDGFKTQITGHNYTNAEEHIGRVYGDLKNVLGLSVYGNGAISEFDASKCSYLKQVEYRYFSNLKLNLTNMFQLEGLICNENGLTVLDVSKNTQLTSLKCNRNALTVLNVSNNTQLISLKCGQNQISSLDLTKNTKLLSLTLDDSNISTLDLSKNIQLRWLEMSNNPILRSQVEMQKLANSLPNRTGLEAGHLDLGTDYQAVNPWIESICKAKNWIVSIGYYDPW